MNAHATNFGLALAAVLQRGDQTRLAQALDSSTSTISGYVKGESEPPPRTAVRIEEVLGVEPGSLTIHLGYLPPAARDISITTPEEAIIADASLTGRAKRVLLDLLSEFRGGSR
jgi:transcriptional regulator with XRE-family HTH domain